jgi:hypothetical protein
MRVQSLISWNQTAVGSNTSPAVRWATTGSNQCRRRPEMSTDGWFTLFSCEKNVGRRMRPTGTRPAPYLINRTPPPGTCTFTKIEVGAVACLRGAENAESSAGQPVPHCTRLHTSPPRYLRLTRGRAAHQPKHEMRPVQESHANIAA